MDKWQQLLDIIFYIPDKTDILNFSGRVVMFILLLLWGFYFIWIDIETLGNSNSLMHLINLPFHEAGHVLFSPFGRLIQILGGTLGQLLMPTIVMFHFIFYQRDNFGGSVGLWWLGQSFIDCAPYINDARAGELMLISGTTGQETPEIHDWYNILSEFNWLAYDHFLARVADGIGIFLIILALIWGATILVLQFRSQ